jgi:hypothetical protein
MKRTQIELLKELWLDKKVISISNSYQTKPKDPSIAVGVIVDIVPITLSQTPVPLVKFEDIDEPMISFSTLIDYDQNIYNILKNISAKDRWTLIQSFVNRFNSLMFG